MRVRFAPSPTGHLHVGNARTALFNWLLARGSGATFILRIEDTDAGRSTRASEESILEDLRWLGLDWDEGPGVGGTFGPYRQSERADLYHEHAHRLLDSGRAYWCFCSAEQLQADREQALRVGQQPKYVGRCRTIAPEAARRRREGGEAAAIRFAVPEGGDVAFEDQVRGHVSFARDVIGDPIIVRSDGNPAYNFAVVVDDALMKVTHVIRGEDHISNTPRQVLFYEAFGYPPPAFAHLSLVLGPDHTPLSKRHGATSVAEFRGRGILPEALVNYLALIGWSPGDNEEILPARELARRFSLEAVGRTAGVFDPAKLAWINRHYQRGAEPGRLASLLVPYLTRAGFVRETGTPAPDLLEYLAGALVPLVAGAVDALDEAAARVAFVFAPRTADALSNPDLRAEMQAPDVRRLVSVLTQVLSERQPLTDREAFRALAGELRQRTGLKGRALFHPLRIVFTGAADGPELDLAVPAIERAAALPVTAGLVPVVGCGARARAFAAALGQDA